MSGTQQRRGWLAQRLSTMARWGQDPAPLSPATAALRPRTEGAEITISVCPYCAVGCSQRVFHRDGEILSIEGNPDSPINAGHLCPKGAATYQLHVNPHRITTVLHRSPFADRWEQRSLPWAMERVAQLIKETRDATFVERSRDGELLNQCTSIASLGGATLDNEENYLIKKLLCGGLGILPIENQARI